MDTTTLLIVYLVTWRGQAENLTAPGARGGPLERRWSGPVGSTYYGRGERAP